MLVLGWLPALLCETTRIRSKVLLGGHHYHNSSAEQAYLGWQVQSHIIREPGGRNHGARPVLWSRMLKPGEWGRLIPYHPKWQGELTSEEELSTLDAFSWAVCDWLLCTHGKRHLGNKKDKTRKRITKIYTIRWKSSFRSWHGKDVSSVIGHD